MLFSKLGCRHGDVLFHDRDRLSEFPCLIELQAALVDRLQLRGLLLRAEWNAQGNQQRNRYQTYPARGAGHRERNPKCNSASAAGDDRQQASKLREIHGPIRTQQSEKEWA